MTVQPRRPVEFCAHCNDRVLPADDAVTVGESADDGLPVYAHASCAQAAYEAEAQEESR